MNFTIKNAGSNYLAKVFILPELDVHPNADKLAIVRLDGHTIITSKDAKVGTLYVHFPLECAISKSYLGYTDSFSNAEDNCDNTKKGFFPKTGRVRCVKLRGVVSEGYVVPFSTVVDWLYDMQIQIHEKDYPAPGTEFDSYGEELICEKYVNGEAIRIAKAQARNEKNRQKKVVRESKLIEGQFRLSEDTSALKRNMHKVQPDDIITIDYKMHGCNAAMGRVLCKKPLKWYEKLLKKVGICIADTEYALVYASRTVVKSEKFL